MCDVARGKNSELGSTGGARESAGKIAHHNQTSLVFYSWDTKYFGE